MSSPLTRLLASAALSLAAFTSPALARAETPPAPAAAPAPETVHPALWKIADTDTTIYLFGTIHILPASLDWFNGPLASAFATSDVLVTEIPEDAGPKAQTIMMKLGQRSDGKTLRETLGPDDREAYEAQLASLGFPASAFDGNDAWFAALVLSLIPLQASGYDLSNGIDKQITARAKAQDMEMDALETPEFQINLFESLPAAIQTNYLSEVIEAMPTMQADIADMVTAWKSGKPEELARIINQSEDDPAIREALLERRNANWADWLEQRMAEPGTVFVAVGAGHLAGDGSVQALLAADGIKAQRVQ